MNKYIIFISDDFGMTHSVNRGIVNAMTGGLVSASNFMVAAPWFNDAFQMAETEKLPVGIHLNMTCEWENFRWRPLTGNTSICDKDGTFFRSYDELLKNAYTVDIYNEYKAQVEYLLSLNWNITHIDTHMLPPAFCCDEAEKKIIPIVERIAEEYNLIYLYGCQNNQSLYFDTYYEKSGRSEEDFYRHLSELGDGFHLVITHCAIENDEQLNITTKESPPYPWALEYRKNDLMVLTSQKLKNFINKNNFKIISVPHMLELQKNNKDKLL